MNFSKTLSVLMTSAFLTGLAPSFAHDGGGSGTRGGGHVIDVDSTPYLMDLVTRAVCDWNQGREVINSIPSLKIALDQIGKLNWYLARDLEREIAYLNFCMAGPLWKVPAIEDDSLIRPGASEKTRQAAYRLNSEVYVDADILHGMDAANQAMLIIHEVMHTYIPMNTPDRAMKLRSMVKTLDQVRRGQIVTRQKLKYAMEMNNMAFPHDVDVLDVVKGKIMFLTASLAEQVRTFRSHPNPKSLFILTPWQLEALTKADQQLVVETSVEDIIMSIFQDSTPEKITELLDNKIYQSFDAIKIAFTNIRTLNIEQQKAVLKSKSYAAIVTSGFDDLLQADLSYKNFLIQASPELQSYSATSALTEMPLLDLKPVSKLPQKLMWLVETMILASHAGVLKDITESEAFYKSLGLKNQKAKVLAMEIRYERERVFALKQLIGFSTALIDELMNEIAQRTEASDFDAIKKQIKFNKF